MAKIALLLMFLVAAASLSMVLGVCNPTTACPIHQLRGGEDEDELCQATLSRLECLQRLHENNPQCSIGNNQIKKDIETTKDSIEKITDCGAASLVTTLVVTLGLSSLVYFLSSSQ